MGFVKGHQYHWQQILDETGADGSPPYYLPHTGNKVMAACLTLDRDPDAPNVILAGSGPLISLYADYFCAQSPVIPVFVKGNHKWLCCGYFKLSRQSTNAQELAEHSAKADRTDVYKILFLEEIQAAAPQ